MATIADAMLLCASSPHARKGALWSAYAKHFGKENDPILVWQAATRDMNALCRRATSTPTWRRTPHVPAPSISRNSAAISKPSSAARGGRGLRRRLLRAAAGRGLRVVLRFRRPGGRLGRRRLRRWRSRTARARASSSIWCASAARRSCRRRSSTSSFRCSSPTASARSSATSGLAVFRRRRSRRAASATKPRKQSKSDIYRDALPLLNSGRITLPKNDRLFNQLVSLERHVARGGHDVIDHPQRPARRSQQRRHGRCGAGRHLRRLQS